MSDYSAVVYVLKISNTKIMFLNISRGVAWNWDLLVGDLYISCIYLLIDTNIRYVCGTVLINCFVCFDCVFVNFYCRMILENWL